MDTPSSVPSCSLRRPFQRTIPKLRRLVNHREHYLSDYVSDAFEDVKGRLVGRGCLPKIKDDTRLLVINDEAQFLGDQFNGSFQSMSSSDETDYHLLFSCPKELERYHHAFIREDQIFNTNRVLTAVDIEINQVLTRLEERRRQVEKRNPSTDIRFP
ncbi:hypothetical protein BG011_001542, partial [Mortierella polycephala]